MVTALDANGMRSVRTLASAICRHPPPLPHPTSRPTQWPTQRPTERLSQKPTNRTTEKLSQRSTNSTTESLSQKPPQKMTQILTQKTTQRTTERLNQRPTQRMTQRLTQRTTQSPTQSDTTCVLYALWWCVDKAFSPLGYQFYTSLFCRVQNETISAPIDGMYISGFDLFGCWIEHWTALLADSRVAVVSGCLGGNIRMMVIMMMMMMMFRITAATISLIITVMMKIMHTLPELKDVLHSSRSEPTDLQKKGPWKSKWIVNPGCGRRVCYFTEYFPTGPGNAFDPATDVDPSLCSHLIYAFASLRGNHLKITSVKPSKL